MISPLEQMSQQDRIALQYEVEQFLFDWIESREASDSASPSPDSVESQPETNVA